MGMEEKEVEKIIYCEWCGEFPYYISVLEDEGSEKETLMCKNCYGEYVESNQNYLNLECLDF